MVMHEVFQTIFGHVLEAFLEDAITTTLYLVFQTLLVNIHERFPKIIVGLLV